MNRTLLSLILLILLLLQSCGCKKKMSSIDYDYTTKSSTYYTLDENGKSQIVNGNNIKIVEGSNIDVTIKNYNPIVHDITLAQDPAVLYYMSTNQNGALSQFLNIPKTPAETPESLDKDDKCRKIAETKTKLDEINLKRSRFINLYNQVVKLDNQITQLKYMNYLTEDILCKAIENDIIKIKEYPFDSSQPQPEAKNCIDHTNAAFISDEKDKYYKYFERVSDSLRDNLENITKEIAIKIKGKKKEKGCEYKDPTDELKATLKKIEDLKEDYLKNLSPKMDVTVNNYKALLYLKYEKKFTNIKIEETDAFVLKLTTKNSLVNSTTTETIVNLPVTKGLKIDYSAGVFFSRLYDQNYTKTIEVIQNPDNTTTNKYKIETTDNGKLSYGAMGFVNFHSQWDRNFNIGGSLGAGFMFNQSTKLVLSPTASFIFGKYQRAILHLGAAFAQVNRIHSMYGDNQFTDANYVPETKSDIQASFLVGISYNLTRK